MTTHTTHTTNTATLADKYAQACDALALAQEIRDALRADVLNEMRVLGVDRLEGDTHTVTRESVTRRAFDVETLRALVPSDTFASVTRESVEPKAFDKARKSGAITDDTARAVVSVARTDDRVNVFANAESDTAREFTPSPF